MTEPNRKTLDSFVIRNRPKLLHVSPWFMPARFYGGPVESTYRLCLALARLGWDVKALTTNANGPSEVLPANTHYEHTASAGFDIRYCPRLIGQSVSPALLRHLVGYIRWADIVHLTAVYSFPTIPTLMACRILRRPLIWSPRGALQRWRGSRRRIAKYLWELGCRGLLPRRTVLHLTSSRERDESSARVPGRSCTLIPNGVIVPKNVEHTPGDGTLRLGYIGRLDPKKGIENMLEACRKLALEGHAVRFQVAGNGDGGFERELRSRAADLVSRGLVDFRGLVTGAAKRRFFAEIDIAVTPSFTENFGMVVAEALAHEVPVIASKGTPWARIEEMGCGHWVENDVATLAQTVKSMTSEPLAEMGRRGRQWMLDEFSWERVARDMSAAYIALIHGETAATAGGFSLVKPDAVGDESLSASLRGN